MSTGYIECMRAFYFELYAERGEGDPLLPVAVTLLIKTV